MKERVGSSWRWAMWPCVGCLLMVLSLSFQHCAPVECRQSSDCKTGENCLENKCVPATKTCSADSDCAQLEKCVNGQCAFQPPPSEEVAPDGGEATGDGGEVTGDGGEVAPEPTSDGGEVTPEPGGDGEPVIEEPAEIIPDIPTPVGKECLSNADCGGGVCEVSYVKSEVVKACAIPKKTTIGEKCEASANCSTGLCNNRTICVSLCSAHRHCPDDHFCLQISYIDGKKVGGCVKGPRKDCFGDLDCPKGQFCQLNFDPGNNQGFQICGPPTGKDKEPPGADCTPDDFPGVCASHVCDKVLKKCLELCQPGLPCQDTSHVCQVLPYLKSQATACFPPPATCEKQGDCPATTTCQVAAEGDKATYLCQRDSASRPKKAGEACDPNEKAPGSCASGLCYNMGNNAGVCVETCKADGDCKADAKMNKCGKMPLGGVLVRACIPDAAPCQYDGTCPASQPSCILGVVNDQLVKRCGEPQPSTKKIGESCSGDNINNDCGNRFCEPGTKKCVAPCDNDSQCPSGLSCREALIDRFRTKACVPPKDGVCQNESDCIAPEYCRVLEETNPQGTVLVGRCKLASRFRHYQGCQPAAAGEFTTTCDSNVCLSSASLCAPLCVNDDDCLGKCKAITLKNKQQKVCDPICTYQGDCSSGQVCAAAFVGAAVRGQCRLSDTQRKKLGDTCDPTKGTSNTCDTGFCDFGTKTCVALCRDSSDCSSGQVCATARIASPNAQVSAKVCVGAAGSCSAARDCPFGWGCLPTSRDNAIFAECAPFDASRKNNDADCTPASTSTISTECKSGYCESTTKTCASLCASDADCTNKAKRPTCKAITLNGASFQGCQPQ